MKQLLQIIIALIITAPVIAQDYLLTIDGEQYEIDLGETSVIELADGKKVNVALERKAVVTFRTDNFSFSHPSVVSPSRTDLGDGIHQTMMASPTGTMVMIQEYEGLNPTFMVDLMMSELLKEERQYGYDISESPATQTLASGDQLKGKMAVSKYRGDEYVRHVITYGTRDAGLLIITQIEKNTSKDDFALIDTFWGTFVISME